MKCFLFWVLAINTLFSGCASDPCRDRPEIDTSEMSIEIERLEEVMFDLKSQSDVTRFLRSNPAFVQEFLGRDQYPHDSILVNNILRLSTDPFLDTLRLETKRVFGDFSEFENQFKQAFGLLQYYYPEAQIPKIQTVITGFGQDLFISDSLIIIGLDYFLGPSAKYRPLDYPTYIQARFAPEFIVPTCMLHLTKIYNQTDYQDKSLLAEMIFFGKSYYMVEKILPCADDSLIVQYTGEQMRDINDNQKIIWASFLQNQLIFQTSHFTKSKFIGERPSIPEIGTKCPGRIGAWIGWQIVRSYMEDNPSTLSELMANSNAPEIFRLSGYKP